MRIYRMTATFGKLDHQILTLEPGLNILHAPNEWGKSTWCAFLVAMLYGIETRVHTTKAALADKERYAPWNGQAMSGRIDLCWKGRDITIERSSKGRSILGVFRAYETHTGLEVPQLQAENCGQVLLGVEKSVFLRSGFLKLTDLPVTQDESLRRRLNALVTTSDESGTADTLSDALKDLKNRCRANRATGLLPQAEQQRSQLTEKLRQLEILTQQAEELQQRQLEQERLQQQLKNHQAALSYQENQAFAQRLNQAKAQQEAAEALLLAAQERCNDLPEEGTAHRQLAHLEALQAREAALQRELGLLPQEPQAPLLPPVFRDVETVDILQHAQTDETIHREALAQSRKSTGLIPAMLLLAAGMGCMLIPHWAGKAAGALALAVGLLLARTAWVKKRRAGETAQALALRYAPLEPGTWALEARRWQDAWAAYQTALQAHRLQRQQLSSKAADMTQELEALGMPLAQCQRHQQQILDRWAQFREARKEFERADSLVQALGEGHRQVAPPTQPDPLTATAAQTASALADCQAQQRLLHEQLGRCRAQIELLGSREALENQLTAVNQRIADLEDTLDALEIAQQTLQNARAELQRRFAPKISQRAQELFSKLTQGRYDRLTLSDDFTVHAGAADEDTLHSALWRSDGTVDQLYLALRLAVAEALTPEAPFILDDALVRFDDARLQTALEVLQEVAQARQVLLFTCQKREREMLNA